MRLASLGSGSGGNATIIESGENTVLVDCGLSFKDLQKRLKTLQLPITKLTTVFITHEHMDHCKGLRGLLENIHLPVYLSYGTCQKIKESLKQPLPAWCEALHIVSDGQEVRFGNLSVQAVTVPHDSKEPLQFILKNGVDCLGILTDLGSFNSHIVKKYRQCNHLLIEANYDSVLLKNGPYPDFLKQRVASNYGHLSNQQCVQLLENTGENVLEHLIIGHMSQKNNTVEHIKQALRGCKRKIRTIHYAMQDEVLDWINLSTQCSEETFI